MHQWCLCTNSKSFRGSIIMTRQLDYYYRHKAEINAKRRKAVKQRKTALHTESKTEPSRMVNEQSALHKLRIHRLYIKYPLYQAKQRVILNSKELALNNNSQTLLARYGIEARRTTKHLIIQGPQLISELAYPVQALIKQAIAFNNAIALQLERELSVELKRKQGNLIYKDKLKEIGITQHSFSKTAKKIIPLYWNKITGRVEVWADASFKELETNQEGIAPRLQEFTRDIVELNAWHEIKQDIHFVAQNARSHAELVQEVRDLIRELRNERKQRRL
jgi:methyl-accepting chemotaxis protein